MSIQFKGAGLPGVHLINGYSVVDDGDGPANSYEDLEGLYFAIAKVIACGVYVPNGSEIRFLRKRLGWSQGQLAGLVGKTDQAVAKWEKGESDVPLGDAKFLRLAWIGEYAPDELRKALQRFVHAPVGSPPQFCFEFVDGKWEHAGEDTIASLTMMEAVIQTARWTAKAEALNGADSVVKEAGAEYTAEE